MSHRAAGIKRWRSRLLTGGLAVALLIAAGMLAWIATGVKASPTCSISWVGGSGSWSTASNWSPAGVPASTDDVCITAAGTYTVTLTGSVGVSSLAIGGTSGTQTLVVNSSGSSLTVAAASSVGANGVLALGDSADTSTAVLAGPTASLTNAGQITVVRNGYLRTNVVNNGTIDIAGTTLADGSGGAVTLINSGTLTVEAGINFTLSGGSSFVNAAGSIANSGTFTQSGGTFTKRAGSAMGTPIVLVSTTLDDDTTAGTGAFEISGTVTVTGTGGSPGIAAGQTLRVLGTGSVATLAADLVNDGTIVLGDGTNSSSSVLSGTTHTLTNNGQLNTIGPSTSFIRTNVVNKGSVDIAHVTNTDGSGGAVTVTNSGTFTVETGASYTISGSGTFANDSGTVINKGSFTQGAGTFVERAGTVTTTPVVITNATLDDDTTGGTALFDLSGIETITGTGGSPGVAAGQTVRILGNGSAAVLAKDLTNAGAIILGDGTSTSTAALQGTSHTLTNAGHLNAISPSHDFIRTNVVNQGIVDIAGSTFSDSLGGAVTITQAAGTLTVESSGAYSLTGGSSFSNAGGTFANSGTFTLSGGSFIQRAGTTTGTPIVLSNATLDDNTTAGTAAFDLSGGTTTLTGTAASPGIAPGQIVRVLGNGTFFNLAKNLTNAGTIVLGDGTNSSNAVLEGATQTLTSTGNLDTVGPSTDWVRTNVVNQGIVDIAGVTNTDSLGGRVTITNNATFTVEAATTYTISGTSSFTNAAGTLVNSGTFTQSGGTFTERGGVGVNNPVTLTNTTLDDDLSAASARFNVLRTVNLTGTGSNPGIAPGQTLTIEGSGCFANLLKDMTNAGTIDLGDGIGASFAVLEGATHTLTNTGTINLVAPSTNYFRVSITNTGTVHLATTANEDGLGGATTFTNDGLLTIPSGVALSTTGGSSFAQGSGGTLSTTVTVATGKVGQVAGSGGVHLAGTLAITTVGTPVTGTQYTIVSDGLTNGTQFGSYAFGAQPYTVQYTATAVTITVAQGLGVSTSSLPDGSVGVAYTAPDLAATGGVGAVTWAVTAGSLPPGVSLSSAGAFSGTPTTPWASTFTVTATDSGVPPQSASAVLSITIAAPTLGVVAPTLPAGQVGVTFPATALGATGGVTPYHWTIITGALPTGLTISDVGTISGTPTGPAATSNFTVQVTDSETVPQTQTENLSITIAPASLLVTTTSLPAGQIGVPYPGATLASSGGTGAVTWAVTTGSLPAGLSLNPATGGISGTPTGPSGVDSFTVTATDSGSPAQTAPGSLSITIAPASLLVTTTSLPAGQIGVPYPGATLASSGGTGAVTWAVTTGSLPAGLSLNPATGGISGTPTGPSGVDSFTVTATDSGSPAQTAPGSLSITIAPASLLVTTTSLPAGQIGAPYPGATLASSGGTGAVTWQVTSGSLPPGLSLDSPTGAISGTPTGPSGTDSFTVTATDSGSPAQTAPGSLSITIAPASLLVTTTSLPAGQIGAPYPGATLASSGGTGAVTWQVTSGSLPPGLSLDSPTGAISGTPTGPSGTDSFTVTATDSGSPAQTAPGSLSITIAPASLLVTTTSLPAGQIGAPYPGTTLASSGGTGAVTWQVTSGSLPPGLSLDSPTGAISGTPTGPSGTDSFTVTATDSGSPAQTAPGSLSITIAPASLLVTTTSLPAGQIGAPYPGTTLASSGGTGAVTWAVTTGTLPLGLSLDPATGAISGTPTGPAGTDPFTVTATDSGSPAQHAPANLSIAVKPAAQQTTVTITSPNDGFGYVPASWLSVYSGLVAQSTDIEITVSDALPVTRVNVLLDGSVVGQAAATPFGYLYHWNTTASTDGLHTLTATATDSSGVVTTSAPVNVQIDNHPTDANAHLIVGANKTSLTGQVVLDSPIQGARAWAYSGEFLVWTGTGAPQDIPATFNYPASSLYAETFLGTYGVPGQTYQVVFRGSLQVFLTPSTLPTDSWIIDSAPLTVTVPLPPPPAILTATLPGGLVGKAYSATLTAGNGQGPFTWSVTGGSLPGGLLLDPATGVISGTPAGVTTASVTITATDSETPPRTAIRNFTISVTSPTSTPTPCGSLLNCQSASNSRPTGTVTVSSSSFSGSVSVTATGTGGVTVGRYSGNPTGVALGGGRNYFDVVVSSLNTFSSLKIKDCALGGGNQVQWFNPATGTWQAVQPQFFTPGRPACVTMNLSATSSPSMVQLSGTVFGVTDTAPTLSLDFTGSLHTSFSGAIEGPGLSIDTNEDGSIRAITGTSTIVSADLADSTTATFDIRKEGDRYRGTIKIIDTATGLSTTAKVDATTLTPPGVAGIGGTASGQTSGGAYTLDWSENGAQSAQDRGQGGDGGDSQGPGSGGDYLIPLPPRSGNGIPARGSGD